MTSRKSEIIIPSEEEDAVINAQIAADPDDREWTDEDFATALTAPELLSLYPHLARPSQFAHIKPAEPVLVEIDIDVVKHFRKSGEGWEKRLNQALRDAVFGNSNAEK